MNFIYTLLALMCVAFAERTSYEGYKVYKVTPAEDTHAQLLEDLKGHPDVDFWNEQRNLNEVVDIMVSPLFKTEFEEILTLHGIIYTTMFDNLETAVEEERIQQEAARARRTNKRISFDQYYRHAEINEYLLQLELDYPEFVELDIPGTSLEGRPLIIAKLSTRSINVTKPAIVIDGGIHAREWIAPAVVLYVLQELVENPANRHLLDYVDWYLLPVLNPDGYEYTFTTTRLWRKTRSHGATCYGIDGNRNFDFHWGSIGASASECDETYRGPIPKSEIETRVYENFIRQFVSRVEVYLSFHSYGNLFLYPYGYTTVPPYNEDLLAEVADAAVSAIKAYNSTTDYTVGAASIVLYSNSGSSRDWAHGALGIPLSYTVELPSHGNGFILPPESIAPVVGETFEAVKVFGHYVASLNQTRTDINK